MMGKCIYILICCAITICADAENLLSNPSFEDGEKSPDHWVRYRLMLKQTDYSQKAARTGKRGVAVLGTNDNMGSGWLYEKMIPVKTGEKYKLSGWIKSNSWGGNGLRVSWFGVEEGRPKWRFSESTEMVNGKKEWTYVECVVTVPKKVKFAKIIAGRKWMSMGEAYFDDISFEKFDSFDAETGVLEAPRLDWSKSESEKEVAPENKIDIIRLPVKGGYWQKMRSDAGELNQAGEALEIRDTALKGVGWMGAPVKVEPGKVYGLESEIELKKAYHVALGAAFYDAKGKLIKILMSKTLQGSKKEIVKFFFRAPPETAFMRLLLTQSRSSGSSFFRKLALFKSGEDAK
jgi:hypothetical protein